jgi:hypothetical protein
MLVSSYLENIQLGKLVNFDLFRMQLEEAGYKTKAILAAFEIEKVGRSKYRLSIIDEAFFATLLSDFPAGKAKDRTSAAEAGDSHRQSVSHSLIVLYPDQASHPVVILNSRAGIQSPIKPAERLLIIENVENFARKEEMVAFLKGQFSDFNDTALDIALGAGNSISNRLNAPFLAQYKQIDCLFDIDIGGLQTFANLITLTHHPALHFLLPPSAKTLMNTANSERKIRWSLQDEQLPKLRELHKNQPLLREAINLIIEQKMMLEQELYLQD